MDFFLLNRWCLLPLETVLVDYKRTEVKASPFKIADDKTPVPSIIEQNNFTNSSLHIIGQQLNRIEEKTVEKLLLQNLTKRLIDLPNQRKNLSLRTSQAKTLEIVEKMPFDLKVKTEGTSTSTTRTISRNEKETVFEENTESDSLSSVSAKNVFDNELPKIKKICWKI